MIQVHIFLFTWGSMWKNVLDFVADISPSVHNNKKNKDILILVDGLAQGMDDSTLTAEAIYSLNFTQPKKRFVLSLHYNGSKSFLFVNATKTYTFKTKNSQIKDYARLCV